MLIDPLTRRQQDLPDEGSASCFAADQPHLLELGIDPRRGGKGDMFPGGERAVRRQASACRDLCGANQPGVTIHDPFVARFHQMYP